MINRRTVIFMAAAAVLAAAAPAFPQAESSQGQGQAVVTVLPKHDGDPLPASVTEQDLAVKVNGKNAKVTAWAPFQSPHDGIELVLMIDDSARTSLGRQIEDLGRFIDTLPPNVKIAVAYMQNGRAVLSGPLSAGHAEVSRELHLPGGGAGADASPYFCLSDLAKNWPSQDPGVRREVVMVTDGVDNYERQFDPDDPYVKSAIADSVRARIVVYSLYWLNQGRIDRTPDMTLAGQSLLNEVAEATGGKSFWQGQGNPVSFEPFLDELTRRSRNQYELGLSAPLNGKPQVETLKLKLSAPGTDVDTPQQVYMTPAAAPRN
jgi:hypothetical protein